MKFVIVTIVAAATGTLFGAGLTYFAMDDAIPNNRSECMWDASKRTSILGIRTAEGVCRERFPSPEDKRAQPRY